jgi:fimbrial isopeptide formation D2 family protein/uncharacterized repeat protein (TIGR01451 family)
VITRSRAAMVALFALLASILGWTDLLGTPPASAAGSPDVTITIDAPAQVLIGESADITFRACNPTTTDGFNASFRVVLPAGVAQSGGRPADVLVADQPSVGRTTLLFSNVSDLLQGACTSIDLTLASDPDNDAATRPVGSTFTVDAGVYVNGDAFYIPDFDAVGQPIAGAASFTGNATATSAPTQVIAFVVEAIPGENGEGELTRGVHGADPKVWAVRVRNNTRVATTGLTVVEVLDPGLEFLGCGGYLPDSTTAAFGTGTSEEYVGSGPLATGASSATCRTPSSIATLTVDEVLPGGTTAAAGSTRITWSAATLGSAASLAPGATLDLTYLAGIPMYANAPFGATVPTPASLLQGRNLDNNTGPATSEGSSESSFSQHPSATGTYQGPTQSVPATSTATDTGTVSGEDLLVRKSTTGTVIQGTVVTSTLVVETGEYRDAESLVLTDTLPDGLCPTGHLGTGALAAPECAATGPEPTIDLGGGAITAPYTSATENADGTWTLVWAESTVTGLAALSHDATLTVQVAAIVRTHYQQAYADAAPVLSGDGVTNAVALQGIDNARTDRTISDPEPDGQLDFDVSSASIEGSWPTIDKRVSTRTGPLATGAGLTAGTIGAVCAGGTVTWEQGDPTPATGYASGDYVCFDLQATFPADLDYAGVRLLDLLPVGYTLVPGTAQAVTEPTFGPDTIPGTTVTESTDRRSLTFVTGGAGTVDNIGNTFHWTFAAIVGLPDSAASGDIVANQWKLSTLNSTDVVHQLRDYASSSWAEPELSLVKGVRSVTGAPATSVAGPLAANTDGRPVQRNDVVEFRVDLSNAGNVAADHVEVIDRLPTGIACSAISAMSDNGQCTDGAPATITWPASENITVGAGSSRTLTYSMAVPSDAAPSQVFTNTAGVRSYRAPTNAATPVVYYPRNNIDTTVVANTAPANDTSYVAPAAASVSKLHQSTIALAGNSANASLAVTGEQATIGEVVRYRVRATIPEGTTITSGSLSDALEPQLRYEGSIVVDASNVTLLGSSWSTPALGSGGTITVTLPTPYVNAEGSGDDWVEVEFDVRVADVAGASRSTLVDNDATLSWTTASGSAMTPATSNAVRTTIVEPVPVLDKVDGTGGAALPGEVVRYTLSARNPSTPGNVAPLQDATLSDVVPAGLTIVNGTTPVADGGTVAPSGGVWTAADRTIRWNATTTPALATILPNATVTLEYDAIVDDPAISGTSLLNTATLRGSSLAGASANERTSYSSADSVTVTLPSATLTKVADRTTGTIGDRVVYTVRATIDAGTRVYDAMVLDTLADGLVFDADLGGALAIGSDAACPAISSTPLAAPVVNGNGSTSVGWWIGDYVAPSSGPCIVVIGYRARIAPTYVPEGTNVVSGAVLSNTARLAWNSANTIATAPSTPPSPGSFSIPGPQASTNVTVIEPAVAIDKDVNVSGCDATAGNVGDADACATDPGATYAYTLTVRNTGNADAHDLTVTDTPDPQLVSVVAGTNAGVTLLDGWTSGDPAMSWSIVGPLAPGASRTITYTAALTTSDQLSDTDQVVNTADVSSFHGAASTTRSAQPSEYRTYGGAPGAPLGNVTPDTVTLSLRTPHVTVTKTALSDATDARAGTPFTWRIVARNSTGATVANAFGVDVVDTLPAGWTYVNGSARVTTPYGSALAIEPACAPTCASSLTWSNLVAGAGQPLAPGATITVTFDARPSATLLDVATTGAFSHVNTASVTADDATGAPANLSGPYHGPDSTATARIRRVDLSVAKQVQAGPHYFGSIVDYTVTVNNAGPDAATGVVLRDALPAALVHRATVSASRGSYSAITGLWTIGSIASGATETLVLRVRISAVGPITNSAEIDHADQWDVDSFPSDTLGSNASEDDIASVSITSVSSNVGDLVWFDRDGDHVADVDEAGIPNVRIVLTSAGNDDVFGTADDLWGPNGAAGGGDDIVTTEALTSSAGSYGFVGLPAGRYRLSVDPTTLRSV